MGAMRKSWTDDRLDDFAREVWRRFDEAYRRFDELDRRLDRVETRLDKIDNRFEALHLMIHRTMFRTGLFVVGTLGLGFAGIIVIQLTQ
jgi:DNA anti-recombination protein RmuC